MTSAPTRRRWLATALAAIASPWTPVAAQAPALVPARIGDRVAWKDIALLDGNVLTAAELERSVVVVEFWASWCPFCKRQNPHLQALADRHRGELVVLALSIDKDPAKARAYLKEHGYTFAAAMAPPESAQWFGKREGLPEVWVIDRGRIVFSEPREMFAEDVAALGRFARKAA